MRNYSLTLVIRTSINEANRKKLLETVKDFVKDVKITKEDSWGEKQLAYPIKRETSGFYQNFMFETESELPADLEKRINANEDILRHLLLRNLDTKEKSNGIKEKEEKTIKAKKKAN
ncbi:MAG: 30S ribosomal protein S6 [Candidatus Levybacteria bacterium CG10_big_fil_rev_8_21_14_0_10_35_13]|nr:MAG: 30S ribosomal protein S6 [Candidatus Levybacteria bacterium CG10_big_fil_rev_8_21_14_0_10_35_13]